MPTLIAYPEHEVAYQDLIALIRKHGTEISALEMLAIAANMLGKLVAMQDQSVVTPKQAMEVVARNLELGNRQVVEQINNSKGNA
jgi:hypothetical protein